MNLSFIRVCVVIKKIYIKDNSSGRNAPVWVIASLL